MLIERINSLTGMKKFTILWAGQLVSIMGTTMTKFAIIIWAYEQVGKASTTALLAFFSYILYIILSPLAGVVVDRYSRKKIMIISDLGAGIITGLILLLYLTGEIKVWHLFVAEALTGGLEAFQIPAYSSAVTMMISKDKYDRASGMRSLSNDLSKIAAPVLAGAIMTFIGIKGVMIIDLITFIIAMITLSVIPIPNPKTNKVKEEKKIKLSEDIKFGIKYISDRKGLMYLLFLMMGINLIAASTYFGILPAMILARTGSNKIVLASIQSALGIGGVVGGLIVSIWGCPKKRVLTIIFTCLGSFLLGDILLAINTSVYVWVIAAFNSSLFIPFIVAAQQSIWQSKVEPSIQGRIFSIKGMVQVMAMPLGYILGGTLADYVFEPAMASNGSLAKFFNGIVGTGNGSGMAVMFLFSGILGSLMSLSGFFIKDLRNLEANLSDYDVNMEIPL